MIERHHQDGTRRSSAIYSECERYRYALTRVWAAEERRLLYVMLNPSTATEAQNDPTIERCERRARALGYGGFRAVNLFALRETDPVAMRRAERPVGAGNDAALRDGALWADVVLAAWGVHGTHLGRDAEVLEILRDSGRPLLCLGQTQGGQPRHPLYVAYATAPQPFAR